MEEDGCVENVDPKKRKREDMPSTLTERPQSAPVDRVSGRLKALEEITRTWEPTLEQKFQHFRIEYNPLVIRIDQLQQEQMDLMETLRACTTRIETLEELQKELQKEPVLRQTPLALKKGRKPLPGLAITVPIEDQHYMQQTGLATPSAPRKETKLMYGDAIVDLSVLAAKPSVRRAPSLTPSDLSLQSSD